MTSRDYVTSLKEVLAKKEAIAAAAKKKKEDKGATKEQRKALKRKIAKIEGRARTRMSKEKTREEDGDTNQKISWSKKGALNWEGRATAAIVGASSRCTSSTATSSILISMDAHSRSLPTLSEFACGSLLSTSSTVQVLHWGEQARPA